MRETLAFIMGIFFTFYIYFLFSCLMDGASQSSSVSVGMCSASSGSRYKKLKFLVLKIAAWRCCRTALPVLNLTIITIFLGRGAGDPEQCAFPR